MEQLAFWSPIEGQGSPVRVRPRRRTSASPPGCQLWFALIPCREKRRTMPMPTWARVGLWALRRDLSVREAARRLEVGCSTVWRWEVGAKRPSPARYPALCSVYGVTLIELRSAIATTRRAREWARVEAENRAAAEMLAGLRVH